MSFIKLSPVAFSLLAAVLAAGCAVDPAPEAEDEESMSSEDELRASSVEPGTFKLYADARHEPSTHCDVFTSLELKRDRGARAELEERVEGFCRLAVFPDTRAYRLKFQGTSCGSKIFTGKKKISGVTRTIKVIDHRTRTCKDLQPAKIIVEETDRDGKVRTKYSYDGAPKPTSTWLSIAPRQCGTNPWNGAQPAPGQEPSYLQGEAGEVANYFAGQGVEIDQIGFAHPSEPRAVCMACQCPRGDTLVVKAKSLVDAQKLTGQFGFAPIEGGLGYAPRQCGSNPWEQGRQQGDDRAEAMQLASWAKGAGAPIDEVGFVQSTEPRFVCMACQCPRGDFAVVKASSAASKAKLESLGWSTLAN